MNGGNAEEEIQKTVINMDTGMEKLAFKNFIFETNIRLLKKYIDIFKELPNPVSEPTLYAFILEQKNYMDVDFVVAQEEHFTKEEKHTGFIPKNPAQIWSKFCQNH